MKAAFIASEIAPFASTGGLAEVLASLPRALSALGVESIRIMPLYRRVLEGGFPLTDTGLRIKIPVGFRSYAGEVWECSEPGPRTFFIRRDEFFDRTHLYGVGGRDYDDNFERFLFFQKAAVTLLDLINARVDIVHANDWQAGLVPLFLEHGVQGRSRVRKERTVFTVHNMAYHGRFPGSDYGLTNLPFSEFSMETLEYYGDVNCLKAGIKRADAVTTVSRTYAEEIQQENLGAGLHGVLQSVREKLTGIVNGIDVGEWDPAADATVVQRFTAADLSGKSRCRADLVQRAGLKSRPDAPLLGMVTRLTADKGFDVLVEEMPKILASHPVSLVMLGQGESKYAEQCRGWMKQWPGRVSFKEAYDRDLSHRIIAGSDILLMPSKVEPCGLTQLFGMRYGTIPVVHATGGLKDTVEPVSASGEAGCGYVFAPFEGAGFRAAIDLAVRHFADRALWTSIMRRAMAQDFSWDRSARQYLAIYERLLSSAAR